MSQKKNIQDPKSLLEVSKFHSLFRLPIVEKPQMPKLDRCELRINLLEEELDELKEAVENRDLIGIADALCDLQYVLSGAVLEFGFAYNFKDLFEEIQRSNMSKACKTKKEAEQTQRFYLKEKNVESFIEESNGKYLVYRSSDSKVLKSINYSPANLKPILPNENSKKPL